MKAHRNCTHEGRTERFNLPICHRASFSRLFNSLLGPPSRIHRFRHLSVRMLEDTLDSMDYKRCN
jgi:hypothetical protein